MALKAPKRQVVFSVAPPAPRVDNKPRRSHEEISPVGLTAPALARHMGLSLSTQSVRRLAARFSFRVTHREKKDKV